MTRTKVYTFKINECRLNWESLPNEEKQKKFKPKYWKLSNLSIKELKPEQEIITTYKHKNIGNRWIAVKKKDNIIDQINFGHGIFLKAKIFKKIKYVYEHGKFNLCPEMDMIEFEGDRMVRIFVADWLLKPSIKKYFNKPENGAMVSKFYEWKESMVEVMHKYNMQQYFENKLTRKDLADLYEVIVGLLSKFPVPKSERNKYKNLGHKFWDKTKPYYNLKKMTKDAKNVLYSIKKVKRGSVNYELKRHTRLDGVNTWRATCTFQYKKNMRSPWREGITHGINHDPKRAEMYAAIHACKFLHEEYLDQFY